ncbi:hypothetical protein FIBSPDRAFT_796694 [Athelia psychrophila]|uniref:BTB domain-containing protein n=1 Tax=Athelia psychrophila TaxID=1759441 RepID=A0A166DC48_9AGAM|nr:hypothetical protein FIBSPDRAFT_796694 [Fibularhizoctonia sp. CBS 109695]
MSTADQTTPESSVSDDEMQESVDPVRSDIWYDDGNVVLQADGTQFKVHKSILAQSSSVFNDMFGFPQPPSAGTDLDHLVEGCPVVHLSDSAEEVRYMLQAVFQQEHLSFGENMSFPVLSALLYLGRKYDIRKLEMEARRRLYFRFPMTLDDRDVQFSDIGFDLPETDPWFELCKLARRAGLLSILPHVFYYCCKVHTVGDIKNGWERDGSLRTFPIQEKLTFLAGREAIFKAQAETTYECFRDPESLSDCCTAHPECNVARHFFFIDTFTPIPYTAGLDYWDEDSLRLDGELCDECAEVASARHQAGRKDFWEQLPGMFDLPPWEELLKERGDLL